VFSARYETSRYINQTRLAVKDLIGGQVFY